MEKYFEVKNINKTFITQKKALIALKDISFSINKCDFVCIIGKSGCGKTTLLRIMAGLEHATSGEIICNNKKITKPKKNNIFIFQDFNQLLPWKTVYQNITYPMLLNKNVDYQVVEQKAINYLSIVGLKEFADYYPHKLSGGMKQRVAIARALALEPDVIYMDEPFSSLDSQTREILQDSLLSIWEKMKITIVFITHNIDEAIKLSNKIIILGDNPTSVIKLIENKVEGNRKPTDKGYLELWDILHKSIMEDKKNSNKIL